jgi:hypothetical protein
LQPRSTRLRKLPLGRDNQHPEIRCTGAVAGFGCKVHIDQPSLGFF